MAEVAVAGIVSSIIGGAVASGAFTKKPKPPEPLKAPEIDNTAPERAVEADRERRARRAGSAFVRGKGAATQDATTALAQLRSTLG